MILAVFLFLVYFAVGVLVVLSLWAIQIRFGSASDLNPESFMVRLFSRRRQQPAESSRVVALKELQRSLSETQLELRREILAREAELEMFGRIRGVSAHNPIKIARIMIEESLGSKSKGGQHAVDELTAVLKKYDMAEETAKTAESPRYTVLPLSPKLLQ
jgi:hypothetical protein